MVRKCKKYISLWDRIYKEKLSSLFCSYLKLFYIFLIYRWRTRSFYIWIMVLYISYVGDTLHLCIYFIYMLWKWYTEFLYVLSLSDIFDPLLNKGLLWFFWTTSALYCFISITYCSWIQLGVMGHVTHVHVGSMQVGRVWIDFICVRNWTISSVD